LRPTKNPPDEGGYYCGSAALTRGDQAFRINLTPRDNHGVKFQPQGQQKTRREDGFPRVKTAAPLRVLLIVTCACCLLYSWHPSQRFPLIVAANNR
jgi:23S rRNA A2030 N6-methylase RlmJ